MFIASSGIVNLPNKKEIPLPKRWSDIRTDNFLCFSMIYSQHSLQILCAGIKSHQAMKSFGRSSARRAVLFGACPYCSPVPEQQQSWALQTPGSAPAQPLLAPWAIQQVRAGAKANTL